MCRLLNMKGMDVCVFSVMLNYLTDDAEYCTSGSYHKKHPSTANHSTKKNIKYAQEHELY